MQEVLVDIFGGEYKQVLSTTTKETYYLQAWDKRYLNGVQNEQIEKEIFIFTFQLLTLRVRINAGQNLYGSFY